MIVEYRYVSVRADRCRGCMLCTNACPVRAIYVPERTAVVREHCIGCAKCSERCPFDALQVKRPRGK